MKRQVPPTGSRAVRLGRAGDTPLEARIARQEARLRRIDHQLERLEIPTSGTCGGPGKFAASLLRHQRAEDQVALEGMYLARARTRGEYPQDPKVLTSTLRTEMTPLRPGSFGAGRLSAWINPPACLAGMGCLCAAHARGAAFWEACDATE